MRPRFLVPSRHFEQTGGAHAAADAHRRDDVPHAAALALDQRVPDQARAVSRIRGHHTYLVVPSLRQPVSGRSWPLNCVWCPRISEASGRVTWPRSPLRSTRRLTSLWQWLRCSTLEAVDHSMTSPAPIEAPVQRRGLYEHD